MAVLVKGRLEVAVRIYAGPKHGHCCQPPLVVTYYYILRQSCREELSVCAV